MTRTLASDSWELRHTLASRALQATPVMIVVIVGVATLAVDRSAPLGFALPVLLVAFANWWFFARFPTRIDWDANGRLRFSGFGVRVELAAQEVESIRPGSQVGFLSLRHGGGKTLRLLAQFDGFHEFLVRLKAANPRVELRGC